MKSTPPKSFSPDNLIRQKDAAPQAKVCEATLRNYANRGICNPVVIGGIRYYTPDDVQAAREYSRRRK